MKFKARSKEDRAKAEGAPGRSWSQKGYSLRLLKISHENMWVQAVNCEIGEISAWNPLRIHRNRDLDLEMCAKSDLESFRHHTTNIFYEFRICLVIPGNIKHWPECQPELHYTTVFGVGGA